MGVNEEVGVNLTAMLKQGRKKIGRKRRHRADLDVPLQGWAVFELFGCILDLADNIARPFKEYSPRLRWDDLASKAVEKPVAKLALKVDYLLT